MKLFNRNWSIRLNDRKFDKPIDIAFKVEKSIKSEPNTCELRIWNLSEAHRKELTAADKVAVRIDAGYVEGITTIFNGELRYVHVERDGADLITVIEGKDGGHAYQTARINRSVPAGTSVENVLRLCAEAMGVGLGNVLDSIRNSRIGNVGAKYTEGKVLSGPVARILTTLLNSAGMTWSIQDGNLQVLDRGRARQDTSVLLTPDTGLVEAVLDLTKKKKRQVQVVKVKTLMVPGIYPGRQLRVRSETIQGAYRADKLIYTGDTKEGDWYIDIECKELVPV